MKFNTKVAGIPCYCSVLYYRPGKPAYTEGPPENATEAEPEEFEFAILDGHSRIATWLEKKLTPADHERLLEEFHITNLEDKHGYGL
jgi:hypothetical protein